MLLIERRFQNRGSSDSNNGCPLVPHRGLRRSLLHCFERVMFPGIGDWVVWSELEAMVSHPKVLNVMQIPNYNVLFQYMDNLISAMCNGEFIPVTSK